MFRTELPLTPHTQQLPLSARVLTIGSCFSDTIGARLAADKVSTLVNPFGTVFNPLSACQLLRAAAGEDVDWQQHVVEARGRWQSYDLHASIGADSPVELLQDIQQLLRDTGVFLATADVVVITLGSAWVYRLKETGELVNNCHKIPAEKFDKELLTPDEIINAVAETHAYLRRRNPKLRFVLTVSPVRHLKDTLPLNAVSKSVLRVACHYLSELLLDVSYFPAYELLLDDLRDYRFYAEDMLHPSKVAEDYIWERFARTYFNADFGRFRKEWEAVQKALGHRPLHLRAPEHRQFLENTLERLERLSSQADLRMEILDVRRQIESLPQPKLLPEPELDLEDDEERIDIGEYAVVAKETTTAVSTRNVALEQEADAEEEEDADQDDSFTTDEAEEEEAFDALVPAKKKRRSRGGAKRNKKKHAARLAAEANLETSNSATLTIAATDRAAEQSADEAAVAPRPSVPTVTVTADADMPLQTALERRKRNSRRGKGRNKASEPTVEQEAPVAEASQLPQEPAPSISEPIRVSEDVEATPTIEAATEPTPLVVPSEQAAGTRPARSGRSASEKRAAALRKPHRPASPIKTLYATDTAASETSAAEAPTPTLPATPPVEAPTAAASAPLTQPEPTSQAEPTIPDTKGTGASGQLSARGTATRHSRPDRSRPASAATSAATEAPSAALSTEVPADTSAPTPVATSPAPSAEAPATEVAAAPAVPPAAPRKPRRAPAKPAPIATSAAKAPTETSTTPLSEAPASVPTETPTEPAVTTPTKPARKSRAKPKAAPTAPPVTEAADESPVAASTPARRSRRAAAPAPPAEASAEPSKKEAPKKRGRPARRKPAAPDNSDKDS